jgi:hypothetical protein
MNQHLQEVRFIEEKKGDVDVLKKEKQGGKAL